MPHLGARASAHVASKIPSPRSSAVAKGSANHTLKLMALGGHGEKLMLRGSQLDQDIGDWDTSKAKIMWVSEG